MCCARITACRRFKSERSSVPALNAQTVIGNNSSFKAVRCLEQIVPQILPLRFGGTYHRELLDLELLCRLNSPRHPEEVTGAVPLLRRVPEGHQQLNKEGKC